MEKNTLELKIEDMKLLSAEQFKEEDINYLKLVYHVKFTTGDEFELTIPRAIMDNPILEDTIDQDKLRNMTLGITIEDSVGKEPYYMKSIKQIKII